MTYTRFYSVFVNLLIEMYPILAIVNKLNNAVRRKVRTLKKCEQEQVKLVFKYFRNLKEANLHTVVKSQV